MISSGRLSRIRRDDDDEDDSSLVVPEDVFIKVLSALPVKSLLRFRCLSKRWLDFISNDPCFIRLHSQQSKSKPPLLCFSSCPSPMVNGENTITVSQKSSMDMGGRLLSKFDFRSRKTGPRIMLPTRFDLVCFKTDDLLHVCNPSTRELITLPPLTRTDGGDTFGLGYVDSTDEYKIVRLIPPYFDTDYIEQHPDAPTGCEIFTLGMTEDSPSSYASPWAWRAIGNSPYHVDYQSPAFVDGALHFLINRCRHWELMTDIEQTILAFNVENEGFRLVPRPRGCLDLSEVDRKGISLVEMRGLLCFSCVAGEKMDIWILKDYHIENHIFNWEKEYSIDLRTLDDSHSLYFVPRDIQDHGNKVLIERMRAGRSFYYHVQTASFSEHIWEEGNCAFFSFYKESLQSLKHVLQKNFKFDQIVEDSLSQSQCLADLDPPIYVVRVHVLICLPNEYAYGGYITNRTGQFVAIEGKRVRAGDSIEVEAKAILCGLKFARAQGIQRIGLISSAREIVDAIITGERRSFQRLKKILNSITNLLSKFSWAQLYHDRRMSTQVACHIALHALWNGNLCFNEPPKWFIDG